VVEPALKSGAMDLRAADRETAFHDDVTAVKRILAMQERLSILVARSYVSSISNLNAVSLYPVLAVRLQRGPALSHRR
jgi:hypothetical protein